VVNQHYEMHISDPQPPPNNILTKCAKMTEENHRRHGMNGNVDKNSKECHKSNYGQGGRLKFFKGNLHCFLLG